MKSDNYMDDREKTILTPKSITGFYVIGTPIGNLEDITYRAVKILNEVDLVLCEDTRVTINLLNKYGIKKPTISYHSQSKISKVDKILEMIGEGKTLALVSDAGTISYAGYEEEDPSYFGVRCVRSGKRHNLWF